MIADEADTLQDTPNDAPRRGVEMLGRFAAARLFIVDDNEANVALLRAVLTRAGIRSIFTETDSRQVLRRLPDVAPDLLILDLHMPRLDGFAVLEQVKQFAVRDYLPVLVLTADTTAAASDRALGAGAEDFVTKPFNNNEVVLRVRNLLETRLLFSAVRSAVNLGDNSEQVQKLIARRAIELVGADHAMLAVPADPSAEHVTELRIAVSIGIDGDSPSSWILPVRGTIAGEVFLDGVPRNAPTSAVDIAGGSMRQSGPAALSPLGGTAASGVLITTRTPGSASFDHRDLRLLSTFADQAGQALQRAERHRAYHELAVLADRERIARDLHDHVIQRLFAVGLAMQGTHRREKRPDLAARVAGHIAELSCVIKEIRAAIFDLEEDPAQLRSFRSSLTATVDALTADTALSTSVTMSGPVDALPPDIVAHVHAVVREATANAVRHSHAKELTIAISVDHDVIIDVTDDGIGMPDVPTRHSGTRNLKDRADAAGGTFTIDRADGRGTRLVWRAPLQGAR